MITFRKKEAHLRKANKFKGGIKRKVTLIFSASTFLGMMFAIILTYLLGSTLLRNTIGREYEQIASALAIYVKADLAGEVEDVETYATRRLWIDAVDEANSRYKSADSLGLEQYFKEMDAKWAAAQNDSPLVKEYTENRIGVSIRDILKIRSNIAELFMTDKFGGLVAASRKTSDFYQADEDWWQKAYDGGKGSVYVSDVEFDESSRTWVITIAVPIRGSDGSVVGIVKSSLSIERLFSRLGDFKIGRTGHVSLINNEGYFVYHTGIVPLSARDYEMENMSKLQTLAKHYGLIYNARLHPEKMFVAFAPLNSQYLTKMGIRWTLFVNQDASETFAPISNFVLQMVVITVVLMLLIIPVGIISGDLFARPIHEFHVATEHIMQGDWNYPIKVSTGDEIEQFADTFTEMLKNLRNKQEELLRAKSELEGLSQNLEKKVEGRTKELKEAQEATLNILEDLQEAKDRIEKEAKALEEALLIKTNFTSTVSHELRTPLAAIKESIAIVLDGTAGPANPDQIELLDMAKRNVDRLARLINDILDFQKLESGRVAFRMEDNDINETVREAAGAMMPLAAEKDLGLVINADASLPKLKFDKDKIIQVLANLLTNAIKFTNEGAITVATERGDNIVKVSVKDTGCGVKGEDIPKLFHFFEQLEKGPGRKTGGTGLGLAISKEIIGKHGGKIWAESEFGKGSTFAFILPITERRVWERKS